MQNHSPTSAALARALDPDAATLALSYGADPFDPSDDRRITDVQALSLDARAAMSAVDLDRVTAREFGGPVGDLTERAADWFIAHFAAVLAKHALLADPIGVVLAGTEAVTAARRVQQRDNAIEALELRLAAITAAVAEMRADGHHSASTLGALKYIEGLATGRV